MSIALYSARWRERERFFPILIHLTGEEREREFLAFLFCSMKKREREYFFPILIHLTGEERENEFLFILFAEEREREYFSNFNSPYWWR